MVSKLVNNPFKLEILSTVFPKAMANVKAGRCALCGLKIAKEQFKDDLSIKEFDISGMCQDCQDKTFKGDDKC